MCLVVALGYRKLYKREIDPAQLDDLSHLIGLVLVKHYEKIRQHFPGHLFVMSPIPLEFIHHLRFGISRRFFFPPKIIFKRMMKKLIHTPRGRENNDQIYYSSSESSKSLNSWCVSLINLSASSWLNRSTMIRFLDFTSRAPIPSVSRIALA